MTRRNDKKLLDTNGLIMGSGVGLATLEAMFNMVNTQSLLSANMVRDFELSHPLQMQALASALTQILLASEYGGNEMIDIPYRGRKRTSSSSSGSNGGETEFGAVSDLDSLSALLNKNNANTEQTGNTDTRTANVSLENTSTGYMNGESIDKLLAALLEILNNNISASKMEVT